MMHSYHIIFQFKLSCTVIILICHILSSIAQQTMNNSIPTTTTTSTTSTTTKPPTSTVKSKVLTELNTKNIAEFRDHIRRSQRKLHSPSFDSHHQHCSCDLKDQSCDLNCCCDDFCTPDDRHVFSSCKLNQKSEHFSDTCIDENLIFRNSSHHEMMKFLDLFCIVYENRKYKKLFPDQGPITNMTEYDEKISRKNMLTWSQEPKMSSKVGPKTESIKIYPPYHGQPVWATSMTREGSELEGKFSLPISSLDENGFCDTFHDIQFLTDTEFACIRDVKNLTRECNSHGFLGSSIFHENIYVQKLGKFDLHNNSATTSRADINETALFMMDESESGTNQLSAEIFITKKDQLITDSDRSFTVQPDCMAKHQCVPVHLTHDSPKLSPQLIKQPDGSSQCHGIVSSVNYVFNYHPIDGIESVSAQFKYINLTKSRAFRQRFKVTFKQSEGYLINKTSEIPFEYSGNPGYLFDKPVLFHTNNNSNDNSKTNFSEKIVHYKLPIQKQGNGQCCRMNVMMESIRFGRNHRGGCMLNVTTLRLSRTPTTVCQTLQAEIFDILDGHNRNIDSVASFGNPNVSNSSDWIPFIILNGSVAAQVNSTPNFTHDGRCPSLVTGISIEIIYSLVGDYTQPQNKIISIIKKYSQPQDVRMRCLSLICRKYHNFPLIELSYSVSFISINSIPKTIHGSLPIIHFRLPSDFFYPFSINYGINIHPTYSFTQYTFVLIYLYIIVH